MNSSTDSYWKYQKKQLNEDIGSALSVDNDADFISLCKALAHEKPMEHRGISCNIQP